MAKSDATGAARPLTANQQRFVEEYLVDLNATQAAIRAGYSAKTAEVQGPRLLGNARVGQAIAVGKAARSAKVGITQERVLAELEGLAHSNITHYQLNETTGKIELAPGAPPNAMGAIASVEYKKHTDSEGGVTWEAKFKLWDKPGTLKLAGRHVATPGFFDKIEVTGKDGGPLRIENVRSSAEKRTRALALVEAARQRAAVIAPATPADAAGGD